MKKNRKQIKGPDQMKVEKLWGGRFGHLPSCEIIEFLSGRDVKGIPPCDERLIPYDLWGSRAHVLMLCRQKILPLQDGKKILKGLREIETLFQKGKFKLHPSKEDVHSNVESFLIDRLGIESGGKIHTGRSRNDQIVLDMRLFLQDQALEFMEGLIGLIEALLKRAGSHRSILMPGYTHYQPAMATTFGHLLLSFAEGLERDVQRFAHWFHLFNKNPLGAAAGYGTSFHLDRQLTARLLGFDGPAENVTDPITQRWEAETEFAYAIAMMMNHLSTMAQTLMVLSTSEFQMVRLDDRHCTGSSIMPQKRNPCSLEVMKGKTSFSHGMVMSLLSAGKALFMGYNRESQWTKYWIMDLIDESRLAPFVMRDVVDGLQVDKARMARAARTKFIGTTTLMEWLVQAHGLPLRKAKILVEKAVKYSEGEGLEEVSTRSLERALHEMKIRVSISRDEIEKIQKPEAILFPPRSIGTPFLKRVDENMASLKKRIKAHKDWLTFKRRGIQKATSLVARMEKQLSGSPASLVLKGYLRGTDPVSQN
jgi:argininosuccinate lyase